MLLTQVARALGLQERYDEGHAVLDDLAVGRPEVATRAALERGRLLRSAGDPDDGPAALRGRGEHRPRGAGWRPCTSTPCTCSPWSRRPRTSSGSPRRHWPSPARSADAAARNWDASLLNNLGMVHADAGDWPAALAAFEEALAARERIGDAGRTRVARWMVGWALRDLGRSDEALAVQPALKAELDAMGEEDPYVDEELALRRVTAQPARGVPSNDGRWPLVRRAALWASSRCSHWPYGFGALLGDRGETMRERVRARARLAPARRARRRPIEAIVADLHRLGSGSTPSTPRRRSPRSRRSARVRPGPDRVLHRAGSTHLLAVLPAGAELDAERERVEGLLAGVGVRFPHAA